MRKEILEDLEQMKKGNQLLCAAGNAGKFKPMDKLVMLVAKQTGDMLEVPMYDVKQLNLWQDLFVWLFKRGSNIYDFYSETSKHRAYGYPIYLQQYRHGLKWPRTTVANTSILKPLGSSYAALAQPGEYNELMVVPRFNVVEAVVNYWDKYGEWLDPYWLEEISKDWGTRGEEFTRQKALLMEFPASFDLPYIPERFTFIQEKETTKDVD